MADIQTLLAAINSGDVSKARQAFDTYRDEQNARHVEDMAKLENLKAEFRKNLQAATKPLSRFHINL